MPVAPPVETRSGNVQTFRCPDCQYREVYVLLPFAPPARTHLTHQCTVAGRHVHRCGDHAYPLDGEPNTNGAQRRAPT